MQFLQQRTRTFWALVAALGITLAGCGKKAQQTDDSTEQLKISSDIVNKVEEVVITLPSPLEMTSLLKKSGAGFNAAMLNSPSNSSKYNSANKQAMNLGVYGADLGYTAYFGKTQESMNYLKALNKLGLSLGVSGAFETKVVERIEKNISNQDSLLYLITAQMENAEEYLKSSQRADHATLILTGGWVEGLYMATQQLKVKPSPALETRIGELKLSLNSLLALLMKFKGKEGFAEIEAQIKALEEIYAKGVTIKHEDSPSKTTKTDAKAPADHKGGLYVAEGTVEVNTGSTSKVIMSKETLAAITAKAEAIRNAIVK